MHFEHGNERPSLLLPFSVGGFSWQLTEFIIGVFLQVLGLPFVAVAQVSLFSKVTAEKTQGEETPPPSGQMFLCMILKCVNLFIYYF